ncbi:hypothetical protein A4E84_00415 [Streptomyces qaidamensis]|uniref:Uncharacterized protein n=1 Tax=Streptomyces qaidamensis TaxID=1783515 RepID=A0A143BSQ0_9ACTN|nr:hypothetical protein [Streptomyces qaidamensis]AMW08144.1 hypothetical protein A4E84_00415 [Streptomyces qaidamensis]
MVATQPEVSAARDVEAYDYVTKLVSSTFQEAIRTVLRELQDPNTFHAAVTRLTESQGDAPDPVAEPEQLYRGFWNVANGLTTELCWHNSIGRPILSHAVVEHFAPAKSEGLSPMFEFGFGGFGLNVGLKF